MTDSRLDEKHALALLRRLASDDAFRRQFQKKPAKALAELGVPLRTIVDLDARCLGKCRLASKATLRAAVDCLDRAAITRTMRMQPPQMKLPA